MKDTVLQIRVSDTQKEQIRLLAEANGVTMAEYLLDLVNEDKKHYHLVNYELILYTNKLYETAAYGKVERKGQIYADEYGRASAKAYFDIMKSAKNNESGKFYSISVNGERTEHPGASDFWIVEPELFNKNRNNPSFS